MPGQGAHAPFVVIARSDCDAAILSIPLLGIASSLPLLAMTTGAMTTGDNDNRAHAGVTAVQ
jgi:hypothetical protein